MDKSQVLQHEYKIRFDGLEEYRNAMWNIFCKEFFQKYIPIDSTILDLGAGYGEFIRNIKVKNKYAMDLNPTMSDIYANENINFLLQDCTKTWNVSDNSLDIVFSSNFLEHLSSKSDIEKVINEAYRTLRGGGGVIMLLGPNIRYVYDEYWDFWDHHIAMSDRSLMEILKMSGFKITTNISRFLPYAMSGEGRRITPPYFLISAYLKMPFFWRFFGKQFFITAIKE